MGSGNPWLTQFLQTLPAFILLQRYPKVPFFNKATLMHPRLNFSFFFKKIKINQCPDLRDRDKMPFPETYDIVGNRGQKSEWQQIGLDVMLKDVI